MIGVRTLYAYYSDTNCIVSAVTKVPHCLVERVVVITTYLVVLTDVQSLVSTLEDQGPQDPS